MRQKRTEKEFPIQPLPFELSDDQKKIIAIEFLASVQSDKDIQSKITLEHVLTHIESIEQRKAALIPKFAKQRPRRRRIKDDNDRERFEDDRYHWSAEAKCAWMEYCELCNYLQDFQAATELQVALLPYPYDQRTTEFVNVNGKCPQWLNISPNGESKSLIWNNITLIALRGGLLTGYKLEYKQVPQPMEPGQKGQLKTLFHTEATLHKWQIKVRNIDTMGFNVFSDPDLGITDQICQKYNVSMNEWRKYCNEEVN